MKKTLAVLILLAMLSGLAGAASAEGEAGAEPVFTSAADAETMLPAGEENVPDAAEEEAAGAAELSVTAAAETAEAGPAEPAAETAEAGPAEPAAEAPETAPAEPAAETPEAGSAETAAEAAAEALAEEILETAEVELIPERISETEEGETLPVSGNGIPGETPESPAAEGQISAESGTGNAEKGDALSEGEENPSVEAPDQQGTSAEAENLWADQELNSSDRSEEASGGPELPPREKRQQFEVDLSIRVQPEELTYGDDAQLILEGLESANMDFSIYWEHTDLRETVEREEDRIWYEIGRYGRKLDLKVTLENAARAYRAVLIADNNEEVISEPVRLEPERGTDGEEQN